MRKTKTALTFPSLILAISLGASSPMLIASDEIPADDFSMPVMDAFKITGRGTVITGRVDSGAISVGDTICVPLVSGETVAREVAGIEQFRKVFDQATAGQNVGILVADVDTGSVDKDGRLHTGCQLNPEDEASAE